MDYLVSSSWIPEQHQAWVPSDGVCLKSNQIVKTKNDLITFYLVNYFPLKFSAQSVSYFLTYHFVWVSLYVNFFKNIFLFNFPLFWEYQTHLQWNMIISSQSECPFSFAHTQKNQHRYGELSFTLLKCPFAFNIIDTYSKTCFYFSFTSKIMSNNVI